MDNVDIHLGIAVISQFIKDNEEEAKYDFGNGVTILEALSATGLRSIRYAKEIQGCSKIIANDFSKRAVESIQKNIESNDVTNIVEASHAPYGRVRWLRRGPCHTAHWSG